MAAIAEGNQGIVSIRPGYPVQEEPVERRTCLW